MSLPVGYYSLEFRCDEIPRLPEFPGSAWRGALGHALKRTVCVVRGGECTACMLYRSCAYPYIFETPPPPDTGKMRHYNTVPHPYALRIDTRQNTAESYSLGLTLFGKANQQLPYLIHSLSQAGKFGLGKQRQVFELTAVHQQTGFTEPQWQCIHAPDQPLQAHPARQPEMTSVPEWVSVQLESPLRLRSRNDLVTPDAFSFADLFSPLLRRISLLSYFHTDTALELDFAGLTQAARAVPLYDKQLRWWDWTRYSSRQDTTMQLGGLRGSFVLKGADIEAFWTLLCLGQWAQAGKNTTMGLGQYRLTTADKPAQESSFSPPLLTPLP